MQSGGDAADVALLILKAYEDIRNDLYRDPEDRREPSDETRSAFAQLVGRFFTALQAHGIPHAHMQLIPYVGVAAHGVVEALMKKLNLLPFYLKHASASDWVRECEGAFTGVDSFEWSAMIRDQVSMHARPVRRGRFALGKRDSDDLDFTTSSKKAVLAILRAVQEHRERWPESAPKKCAIKAAAAGCGGAGGGAGDRAIDVAMSAKNGLLTADLRLTQIAVDLLDKSPKPAKSRKPANKKDSPR